MTATARDIRDLLGDVDPLAVERIVEVGATTGEIALALEILAEDNPVGHEISPRVEQLRALLLELVLDEGEPENAVSP